MSDGESTDGVADDWTERGESERAESSDVRPGDE
jgi:hypothetical protein